MHRIIHRMKVTALLPDEVVREVSQTAHGKNLTESLVIALKEWLALKKLSRLNEKIIKQPLKFQADFSAEKIRSLNRER